MEGEDRRALEVAKRELEQSIPNAPSAGPALLDYHAKRRQAREKWLDENCEEEFALLRLAIECAHRVQRLNSDLTDLFPKWRVSVAFADFWGKEYRDRLVNLAPHPASAEQLGKAYAAIYEEDEVGNPNHLNFDEVVFFIDTATHSLACGDFIARMTFAGAELRCELDELTARSIRPLNHPTFDEYVNASGGTEDYSNALSLLHAWIRERFAEACAARGEEPEIVEAKAAGNALGGKDAARATPTTESLAGGSGSIGILDYYNTIRELVGNVVAAIVFIGCWIYCIIHYGFLLGVGLGWLPSLIVGGIVGGLAGLLWPLIAVALAAVAVAIWSGRM